MSTAAAGDDPGEQFLQDLIVEQSGDDDLAGNRDLGEEDFVDDDDDDFSTASHRSRPAKTIHDHSAARPTYFSGSNGPNEDSEDDHSASSPPSEIRLQPPSPNIEDGDVQMANNGPSNPPNIPTNPNTAEDPSIPKGRSIAHHEINKNKLVFVSFDIETGGEYCGILQLSAEIIRMELIPKTTKKGEAVGQDSVGTVERVRSTFNSFVKPPEGGAVQATYLVSCKLCKFRDVSCKLCKL